MNTEELEQKSRQALEQSIERLSPELQKRLLAARQTALQARPKPWWQNSWLGWGLAASLSLGVLLTTVPERSPEQASNSALDEFILLASMDDTDLEIIEDIEFADWLSQAFESEDALNVEHNG